MVEQDYIMRLIKELVRAILKVIFHTDIDMPSVEMLKDSQRRCALEELLNLIDRGEINEAENRLSELLEDGGGQELIFRNPMISAGKRLNQAWKMRCGLRGWERWRKPFFRSCE